MKRFVTYLYECERGHEKKNTGFCRVDIRGDEIKIQISIRGLGHSARKGMIYMLICEEELIGIPISEIKIINGQGEVLIKESTSNIGGSEFGVQRISGIGICTETHEYIASVWDDNCKSMIFEGKIKGYEEKEEKTKVENQEIQQEIQLEEMERKEPSHNNPKYRHIQLDEIKELPSANWHLVNNSFLLHGLWNYGYLVLKTIEEEGETKHYLGVPGIYEKPELIMAMVFGFPNFEKEISEKEENKKSQEPKSGDFGFWLVELDK